MRRSSPGGFAAVILAALAFAACGGGQQAESEAEPQPATATPEAGADPDIAPEGSSAGMPAGYAMRLDKSGANQADYQISEEQGGLRVHTGPAGILYREADAVPSGDYTVSATFTEVGAPANHREAYGLIIGGKNLQGDDQAYSYFLVRGDGKYLVKRRSGSGTSQVTQGWVSSDAVKAASGGADLTNAMVVTVAGDSVSFSINGQNVASFPASELDTHGVAGVRINHNLDVRVTDFGVARG